MTGEPPGSSDGWPDAVPTELLAEWREAEDRLYPIVLVRPEQYERVVGLVGRTVAELQLTCPDPASLVAAAPGVADVVRRLAGQPLEPDSDQRPAPAPASAPVRDGRAGGPVMRSAGPRPSEPELDLPLIAAAACALRHRQLAAERSRRERASRIAAAAVAGDAWVVIAQGQPSTTWPPLPSTTVELHVPSGRALAQTVEVDPGTGARSFLLARVDLDPVTGDPLEGEPAEPGLEYGSEERWLAAIAEERRRIESQSGRR